jgi:hypothetical protein
MADRSRRLHPAHPLRRRRRVADSPADRFSAVEPSARVSRCGSGAFTAAGPITCTALTRAGKEDTGDGLFSPSGSPLESGSPRQLWSSTMRLQVTGAVSISMAQSRWKGRVTRPEERRLDRSTDSVEIGVDVVGPDRTLMRAEQPAHEHRQRLRPKEREARVFTAAFIRCCLEQTPSCPGVSGT